MRILNPIRMLSFVVMVLTSVPLVIHYIQGTSAEHELVVHLHVLSGILFVITAIPTMIMSRQKKRDQHDG